MTRRRFSWLARCAPLVLLAGVEAVACSGTLGSPPLGGTGGSSSAPASSSGAPSSGKSSASASAAGGSSSATSSSAGGACTATCNIDADCKATCPPVDGSTYCCASGACTTSCASGVGGACAGPCHADADCQSVCPAMQGYTWCCAAGACSTWCDSALCAPGTPCKAGMTCTNRLPPDGCGYACACDAGQFACQIPSCPSVHAACDDSCDPSSNLWCMCASDGGDMPCVCDATKSRWACMPFYMLCGVAPIPLNASCGDFPLGQSCGPSCACGPGCGSRTWGCSL